MAASPLDPRRRPSIAVRLAETQSFANSGSGPLEFMIFGIASDMAAKQALMETQRRLR